MFHRSPRAGEGRSYGNRRREEPASRDGHPVDEAYAARELHSRLQEPHVSSLGPLEFPRKAAMLRDARALVMPIDWEEPFGLVMIEALASGMPVVATPRGAAMEIVAEGETGFLCDDLDALVTAIDHVQRIDPHACRARVQERFSAEAMLAAYEELFTNLSRTR